MKKCTICGKEIVYGINGCTWYDTCFTCKPISYPAPTAAEPSDEEANYWEEQILAKQERYTDE